MPFANISPDLKIMIRFFKPRQSACLSLARFLSQSAQQPSLLVLARVVTTLAMLKKEILAATFASLLLFAQSATAATPSDTSTSFATGIQAYRKGEFQSAALAFQTALTAAPQSPAVLHNLALTEWKLGQQGLALAFWRKALSIDASYEPASRSIKWFRGKLDHPEIAHEVEYWETFRDDFLSGLPLQWSVVLMAATLLLAGSILLGYAGAKRRASLDETPAPELPAFGIVSFVLFICMTSLVLAKIYDLNSPRGTVTPAKVQAKSAPDESGTSLFELYAGLEVQIDQAPGAWLQVTYPGGPTGWVPASTVMSTSDPVLIAAGLSPHSSGTSSSQSPGKSPDHQPNDQLNTPPNGSTDKPSDPSPNSNSEASKAGT